MKLAELVEKTGLKPINELFDNNVEGVFISDMVSDIVAGAQADNVLVTIQTHKNLIATANLVDVSAVIFVRGKLPLDDVIDLANKAGITMFTTDKDAWKLALQLNQVGLE